MKGDKITIASQNVRCLGRGFTGNRKRREIKDLYKRTTPQTDILLLQETKLPESACLKQARFIEFKKGSSLWNEGSFSAHTTRFKGGTGIILSERMTEVITGHGVLYLGRAQYITIQLSTNLHLGILNVYGFSHSGPRAMLWDHLANAELPEAQWILGGDFNNIEQASDKQGGSHKTSISRRELEAWNRLLMKLGGRDAHHTGSFVRRSDKHSPGPTHTWMRI
jgi:exonuclease III